MARGVLWLPVNMRGMVYRPWVVLPDRTSRLEESSPRSRAAARGHWLVFLMQIVALAAMEVRSSQPIAAKDEAPSRAERLNDPKSPFLLQSAGEVERVAAIGIHFSSPGNLIWAATGARPEPSTRLATIPRYARRKLSSFDLDERGSRKLTLGTVTVRLQRPSSVPHLTLIHGRNARPLSSLNPLLAEEP